MRYAEISGILPYELLRNYMMAQQKSQQQIRFEKEARALQKNIVKRKLQQQEMERKKQQQKKVKSDGQD